MQKIAPPHCDQLRVGFSAAALLDAALGKFLSHVPLSPSSINLVPAQDGKVTYGCVSGIALAMRHRH